MVKVIANHTLETLRDLKNSINYYLSDPYKHMDALKKERDLYAYVLQQTTK